MSMVIGWGKTPQNEDDEAQAQADIAMERREAREEAE